MSNLLTYILEHEDSFRRSRLPSLYSDLAVQRTTNPDGYAANISAWEAALTHAARAGVLPPSSTQTSNNLFVLQTGDELIRALNDSKYGRPLGLSAVLDETVYKRAMLPLQEFIDSTESVYNRPWLLSPWQILNWGLRQIGVAGTGYEGNSKTLKAGSLVILANLEEVGGLVTQRVEASSSKAIDRVMDVDAFRSEVSHILNEQNPISDLDLRILLRYLERDKGLLSCDGKTVKLRNSPSVKPKPINKQDTTIASLKSLVSRLMSQCSALETRIDSLQSTASMAVKSGNKTSALSALRSKRLVERNLQQRSDTLHQLEEIYSKMEQAADQVEIVEVMEASAGVLKGFNKQIGGVERVEDIVENLREEMTKTDEVTQVITEGQMAGQVDEDEIDGELEAMETEQMREVEEREKETRRKRQEEEVEQTRRRLAEIDQPKPVTEEQANEALSESVERLNRITLEDKRQVEPESG